jgi:hypothetical protein
MVMNVDGRNFSWNQELDNGLLFEPHILTTFRFNLP